MPVDLDRIQQTLTSTCHRWDFLNATDTPGRLLDILKSHLPHIAPESWPQRFWLGGVFVNGRLATQDLQLSAPCRVEYYEPKFCIEDPESHFPQFSEDWIVYEDNDLAVVFKPTRLPCLPNKEQRHYTLKQYLERHYGHDLHLPSRLDTSTCGLVAVSRSARMHGPLQRAFEQRTVEKYYLLVLSEAHAESAGIRTSFIDQDPRHPILRRVSLDSGREAITEFISIPALAPLPILIARPRTGRTHQIRVHCAHFLHPILGDNFYGGRRAESLHLLSAAFGFEHPFLNEHLHVVVPEHLAPQWAGNALKYLSNKPEEAHPGSPFAAIGTQT